VDTETKSDGRAVPWNKGKLLGQKPPLKLREIWAIRIRLQLTHRHREPALFNLAIDSKVARVRFGWASRIRRRTGHSRRSPLRRTKATMICPDGACRHFDGLRPASEPSLGIGSEHFGQQCEMLFITDLFGTNGLLPGEWVGNAGCAPGRTETVGPE
jgi:hypothetical protein